MYFFVTPKIVICKLAIFGSIGSTTKDGCSLYFGSPKIELGKVCHSIIHWKKEQGQLFFFILLAHQIYIVQQVLESQKQVRMAVLVSHYCSPSLGQLFYVFFGSPKIGLCKLVIF